MSSKHAPPLVTRERLRTLIPQCGPRGATTDDISRLLGLPPANSQVCNGMNKLAANGFLFTAGPKRMRRFFLTQAEALAFAPVYQAELEERKRERIRAEKRRQYQNRKARQALREPKERKLGTVSIPRPEPKPAAPQEVIVPPNVKRTVAKAPPGRFEVTGPVPSIFGTRPGQYLPEARYSRYLEGTNA